MEDRTVVGKSVAQVDVREKVTGKAVYTPDFEIPHMLYGKIKRSPYASARICQVHLEKAKRLSGVKAVITAKNSRQFPYGSFVIDELPLAEDLVRYIGDEVAAVAAIDEDTAEEALDLIDVEFEELPAVLDPARALLAPAIHPELPSIRENVGYAIDYVRGDPERGFKEADVVLEETFETPRVHQLHLEPHGCVVDIDPGGRMTMWSSLQSPFRTRGMLSRALGWPEENIRLIMNTVGGGFGAKGANILPLYPICALLAGAAGKPVKMAQTREEEFLCGRPRLAMQIRLKMGFQKDGSITAKEFDILGDAGAYLGIAPSLLISAATRSGSLYRLKNIRGKARLVYTNKVPSSAFRGFGGPQMFFAVESLLDAAAQRLGLDPVDLRLKNATQKGDLTVHGWRINSCALSDTIRTAAEKIGWKGKRTKGNGRGVGMACMVHVAGNRGYHPHYDGSAAYVKIDEIGRVTIISGEMDIGQGANTILAQIASEELGVPVEDINRARVDTDTCPFALGTFADRVTTQAGNAVRLAALDARRKLLEAASDVLECRAEDMEIRDGKIMVKGVPDKSLSFREVAAKACFRAGGLPITGYGSFTVPAHVEIPDACSKYGNLSVAYSFGAQAAEVQVDRKTGQVTVINFVAVHDSGTIINRSLAEGQVFGGVLQGLGFALTEQYVYQGGKVLNPNLTDYKTLLAGDIPHLEAVFIESPDPYGPYGAKGLGEPTIVPTAPAIANAIYNAVGVRVRDLPITSEKICKGLREKTESER